MLRSGAWLLQRSWRQPQRLPAGWRSERFARKVDHTPRQLRSIRTLAALSDPLEVAYVMRWIELHGGRELRGWRTLCQRALP